MINRRSNIEAYLNSATHTFDSDSQTSVERNARFLAPLMPYIISYIIGSSLSKPGLDNTELELSCLLNSNFNSTTCKTIIKGDEEYRKENKEIHIILSNMYSWLRPMETIMPIVIILLIVHVTDLFKLRKQLMQFCILGEIASIVFCLIICTHKQKYKVESLGFSRSMVPSLFGGYTMFLVAISSYIYELGSLELGNERIIIVTLVFKITTAGSNAMGGFLLNFTDIIQILIICLAILGGSFTYGSLIIREPKDQYHKFSISKFLAEMAKIQHVGQCFGVLLIKKERTFRSVLMLALFANFIIEGSIFGESTLLFLYTQYNFQWNVIDFSYYNALLIMSGLIGCNLLLPLYRRIHAKPNLTNFILIVLSCTDKIIANILIILIRTPKVLYIAAFVQLLQPVSGYALQTLCSSAVDMEDLQHVYKLLSFVAILAKAVFTPIYCQAVYLIYIDTAKGAGLFFAGIVLQCLAIIIVLINYIILKSMIRNMPET